MPYLYKSGRQRVVKRPLFQVWCGGCGRGRGAGPPGASPQSPTRASSHQWQSSSQLDPVNKKDLTAVYRVLHSCTFCKGERVYRASAPPFRHYVADVPASAANWSAWLGLGVAGRAGAAKASARNKTPSSDQRVGLSPALLSSISLQHRRMWNSDYSYLPKDESAESECASRAIEVSPPRLTSWTSPGRRRSITRHRRETSAAAGRSEEELRIALVECGRGLYPDDPYTQHPADR
ncbi:uncharacterized protein LOC127751300 [Frankliniella occidentalis]|uniref:Uncharacterized protein LOC127751300 n=1 Tax=Frankliniella occidentalis TaxID=133901 RepID=A0A9C6X7M3_FRAOC|nr:uncharacterized protein LOC127751300 [Frankliniella occidentalis]